MVGRGMGVCLFGHRSSQARRCDAHSDDSRRAAHCITGYQPADCSLRTAHWTDRFTCQTFPVERVEDLEHSSWEVGGIQKSRAEAFQILSEYHPWTGVLRSGRSVLTMLAVRSSGNAP